MRIELTNKGFADLWARGARIEAMADVIAEQGTDLYIMTEGQTKRFLRFVPKTADENGCRIWKGAIDKKGKAKGYARFQMGTGHTVLAHLVAYRHFIGKIPPGLEVDHVKDRGCRNRACVNPEHLEAVPHRINTLRGDGPSAKNAQSTRCRKKHLYDKVSKDGSRRCKMCEREQCRERMRRYRRAAKAEGKILPTDDYNRHKERAARRIAQGQTTKSRDPTAPASH